MRGKSPLVSVLVTAYNRENYIGTAIKSVLAQSFQDFELIVVDDASTDETARIAQQYASNPRVRVYVNHHNIGQFRNRNYAASLARGTYIKYVDSDDALYPHCLEVMAHMMERHPAAGMLLCAWTERDASYPFVLSPEEAYRRCFIHGVRMIATPLNSMFRKHAFDDVAGFESRKWPLSADWDLILKLARRYPVLFAPAGLTFYRIHTGQVFSSNTSDFHNFTSEGLAISLDSLRHRDCPLPKDEQRWAIEKALKATLVFAASLAFKKRQPIPALNYLRSLRIRPRQWFSIISSPRRVSAPYPMFPKEPDWRAFPRARLDRLENTSASAPLAASLTLVIAGPGQPEDWERCIRSALVQSEENVDFVLVKAWPVSDPPAHLFGRYKNLGTLCIAKDNLLDVYNEAGQQCRGDYLRFLNPRVMLYPYALEWGLRACSVGVAASIACAPGILPLFTRFDAPTAAQLDLMPDRWFLRSHVSCVTFSRKAFREAGGFDPTRKEWACYELLLRLACHYEVAYAYFGSSTEEFRPFPDTDPPGEILKEYGLRAPASSSGKMLADFKEDDLIKKYQFNWSTFPWAVADRKGHGP